MFLGTFVHAVFPLAHNYSNPNVHERFVTQPGILRAFDWKIAVVPTRDWYHEPQDVLARIERLVRGEAEPAMEEEIDPVADTAKPAQAPDAPTQEDAAPPAAPAADLKFRRLEFVEGRSSKFWEIAHHECSITVRYGRIGTPGQSQTKTFDSPERAVREVAKLTLEKTRKVTSTLLSSK